MGASSGNTNDPTEPIGGINVTPFVDVVLVLLVIFMITAPAMLKESFQVKLPKVSSPGSAQNQSLGVAVTQSGIVLLEGARLSEAEFKAEVQKRLATQPNLQAIISADTSAEYGFVVRAIDWIKSAGVSKFGLQIERDKKE